MNKYVFFIQAMKAKSHYKRDWMLRAFTVIVSEPNEIYPYCIKHDKVEKKVLGYAPDLEGQYSWVEIEGCSYNAIPYIYHEFVGPCKAGDVENLKEDLKETTWGSLLFNSRVLVYACGDIIPFMDGMLDPKDVEKPFLNMKSDPAPGEPEEPGQLYCKHWVRAGKAIGDLAGYEIFVPSATAKAMQPPPGHESLRKELLEKYKDSLDDPVTQVKIQNQLVANYKENLKGDPAEGFIYSDKSINTAIKRMFLIHGPEAGFNEGGRGKLITNSLDEGIDINHYPVMVNSLRAGSYYRGALTALAGEDVDLMGRIFQNSKILPEFCGTKDTIETVVDNRRLQRYIKDEKGNPLEITKDNISKYNGTIQQMYSPVYCKAGGANINDCCRVCMGSKLAAYPESLGSMVGEIPTTMMLVMMASAHAKELKTTPLDVENFLR